MPRDSHVEIFGSDVVACARDETLDFFEHSAARENIKDDDAVRAKEAILRTFTPEQLQSMRFWVRCCVDLSVMNLLHRIEELHDMNGMKVELNGTDIVRESDGLAAAVCGERGWFAKFSKYGKLEKCGLMFLAVVQMEKSCLGSATETPAPQEVAATPKPASGTDFSNTRFKPPAYPRV